MSIEKAFRAVNTVTGKLPFAGNNSSRIIFKEGFFKEPSLEQRKKRLFSVIGFTSMMILAHAAQAGWGAHKLGEELNPITSERFYNDQADMRGWPEHLKIGFLFAYTLANIMVSLSQAYLAWRALSSVQAMKDRKRAEFFEKIGIHPEGEKEHDLSLLSTYVLDAARGDKEKLDVLKHAVGERDISKLIESSSDMTDWETKEITREEFEQLIKESFQNRTPIFTAKAVKEKMTLREAVELIVTFSGQAVFLAV